MGSWISTVAHEDHRILPGLAPAQRDFCFSRYSDSACKTRQQPLYQLSCPSIWGTTHHETPRLRPTLRGFASEMGSKRATLRHPAEGRLISLRTSPYVHPMTGASCRRVSYEFTPTGSEIKWEG